MRKKGNLRRRILCAVAAAAMLTGMSVPYVYAATYPVEDVETEATIVYEGDVLEFPEWGEQGMLIRYINEEGHVLSNVHTEKGESYTIPAYQDLEIEPESGQDSASVGWRIVKKPTRTPMVMQWDLVRCVGAGASGDATGGDAGRKLAAPGTYELKPGEVYLLRGGLNCVEGDATVYADSISFTVDAAGQYTFGKDHHSYRY